MMKYKALKTFSGIVSMNEGEVREISDLTIAKDLLSAGYIKEIKSEQKKAKKSGGK